MRHPAPALASALLTAACIAAPEPARPEVSLYALDCGLIEIADADMFADDGSFAGVPRDLIVPCYLIRHPDGDLLWDAGLTEALNETGPVTSPGGVVSVPTTLTSQLAALGLTPADIEYISVSHSHGDHIGNGGLFAASTWIVDADERAYAFRDEARANAAEFESYAALETAETVLIEGDADHDVFGDGRIVVIQTPGHTPGHTVLFVDLPEAGPLLLTGDMFHLAETRPGRKVPRFNVDRDQTLASMDKIDALAAETGARVIREHVIEDFESLPAFPEALR
jgi:glyoxylase-like metal-dependent hydrolase (beta-lactamase superfamily II)